MAIDVSLERKELQDYEITHKNHPFIPHHIIDQQQEQYIASNSNTLLSDVKFEQ